MENNELLLTLPGVQVIAIQKDMRKVKGLYVMLARILWSVGMVTSFIILYETRKLYDKTRIGTGAALCISHIRMAVLFFCIAATVLLLLVFRDYDRTPKTQYTLHITKDTPESTFIDLRKGFDMELIAAGFWTATPKPSVDSKVTNNAASDG